ncbi:hypothetical protein, partial [Marinospirillum sp.]|uniref:hypothetical protein n=1 Tax=Marinospirillum sp. TaxID=2183934 RepID=UPI0028703375
MIISAKVLPKCAEMYLYPEKTPFEGKFMSSENFAVTSSQVTTPGQANPPKARAAEVLADKRT